MSQLTASDNALLPDMIAADAAIGHGVGYRFNFIEGWLCVRQRNAHHDRTTRLQAQCREQADAIERLVDAFHGTYADLDDNVLNAAGQLPSVEVARLLTLLDAS